MWERLHGENVLGIYWILDTAHHSGKESGLMEWDEIFVLHRVWYSSTINGKLVYEMQESSFRSNSRYLF